MGRKWRGELAGCRDLPSETRSFSDPGSSGKACRSAADCRLLVVGLVYPNESIGSISSRRRRRTASSNSGQSRAASTAASMRAIRPGWRRRATIGRNDHPRGVMSKVWFHARAAGTCPEGGGPPETRCAGADDLSPQIHSAKDITMSTPRVEVRSCAPVPKLRAPVASVKRRVD